MKPNLRFDRAPGPIDRVLAIIAAALTGHPADLKEFNRRPLVDHQGHRDTSHERRLQGNGVTVDERIELSTVGDPREGYGYDMDWTINAATPGGEVTCSFRDSNWSPEPKALDLEFEGADAATIERVRAALAAYFEQQ